MNPTATPRTPAPRTPVHPKKPLSQINLQFKFRHAVVMMRIQYQLKTPNTIISRDDAARLLTLTRKEIDQLIENEYIVPRASGKISVYQLEQFMQELL